MATQHTTSIGVSHGENSQAFFSFTNPDNLVVFVHGFNGNALTTWNNFSSILPMDNHFDKTDMIFYGYNTFKGQAGDHAVDLFNLLDLLPKPLANGILPANQRLPERNYKKIILVAHSLGAVLVRQALLLATDAGQRDWVAKTTMSLFAPAHNGANIINLASESLPGLSSLLAIFAKFRYPILNDLNPQTHGILDSIKTRSESLQNQGMGEFTKAKMVVFARSDKVVQNIPYLMDSIPIVIDGASHTSVCKPNDKFIKPLELIKTLI